MTEAGVGELVEVAVAEALFFGRLSHGYRARATSGQRLGPFQLIAEGQYERTMLLEKTGAPPITYLDQRGVLNARRPRRDGHHR